MLVVVLGPSQRPSVAVKLSMLWKPPGARCPPLAGHPAAHLSSATQSAAASRGSAPLASSSPFFFLQQSPRPFECVQLGM